jgi:hypothetical protein
MAQRENHKISDRGLQEGNRTLLALIVQDLHERDPRGIIDADMNELPTDAVVTLTAPGYRPVDELARMLAFITPDRFGRLQALSLFSP